MDNISIRKYNALCDQISSQYPILEKVSEELKVKYSVNYLECRKLRRLNHQLKFLYQLRSRYFTGKIRIGKELREYLTA